MGARKPKVWENPLEKYDLKMPDGMIARTVSSLYSQREWPQYKEERSYRESVYRLHGFTDEAIEAIESYVMAMTGADESRAKKYADAAQRTAGNSWVEYHESVGPNPSKAKWYEEQREKELNMLSSEIFSDKNYYISNETFKTNSELFRHLISNLRREVTA